MPNRPEIGISGLRAGKPISREEFAVETFTPVLPPTLDTITPLERCPALVLNADYRPLSYYPLFMVLAGSC